MEERRGERVANRCKSSLVKTDEWVSFSVFSFGPKKAQESETGKQDQLSYLKEKQYKIINNKYEYRRERIYCPNSIQLVCLCILAHFRGDFVWWNQIQCVSKLRYYDICPAIYTALCSDTISTAVMSIMTSSAVSSLLCNQELMITSEELDQKYGFTVFVPDF